MSAVVPPRININGTPKEVLIENLSEAQTAIQQAIEKFKKVSPHGRDYQTYEPDRGAYSTARTQWVDHAVKLQNTARYLEEVLTGILNEGDGE